MKTCLFFLLFIPVMLFAQNDKSKNGNNPDWYAMMQDPKVNYHKAVQAYKDYWKGKKMPPNKEQRETEEYKNFFRGMKGNAREEYERIFLLNKEFKNWMQETEPWVQPDGSILSQEERLALLRKQQEDLKAIEQKNGKN
jgi:hypothetical protein